MFNRFKFALSLALVLGSASAAFAAHKHPLHPQDGVRTHPARPRARAPTGSFDPLRGARPITGTAIAISIHSGDHWREPSDTKSR
jgi:hypothetical protein